MDYSKHLISEDNSEFYVLKDSKFGDAGRTWSLRLTKDGFDKVKQDFKERGHVLQHNKSYKANTATWKLNIYKDMIGGYYDVFGISGDYVFGRTPGYMSDHNAGNKKEAKIVYDQFIKDYNL